jgi:calcineurin-like phosphoesterase family protein
MTYWLLSDTHFTHTKLDEWGLRAGDWQEKLWDGMRRVPAADTLIHLGDVCIGDDQAVHDRLMREVPCRTVLVRGNHDKKSAQWYMAHGWGFVCDGMWLEYMGHTLLLSHRPMQPDATRFTRNIHGHTHGDDHRAEEYVQWHSKDYHIDISPELVGYEPLRLETVLKKSRP